MHFDLIMIAVVLMIAALWCLLLRIGKMNSGTSNRVFAQHVALALSMFASLWYVLIYHDGLRAVIACAIGLLAFLTLGSKRWRNGAPANTSQRHRRRKCWQRQNSSTFRGQNDHR